MIVSKYIINENGQENISERITKSRIEIALSIVFTIAIPLGFGALKSNFFEKVNAPLVFTGILMCAFCAFAMVKGLIKITKAMKAIVNEILFYGEKSWK